MRLTRLSLPILLVLLSDCSCGNAAGPNGGNGGGGGFARIRITPSATTLGPGGAFNLTARCTASDDSPVACPTIQWSVTGGTFAPGSAANDSAGTYTAGSTGGSYTIRASASGISSTASVTITTGGGGPANLTVDVNTTFQTWRGWEATPSAGWTVSQAAYDSLASLAVNDLGVTRLRLEVSGNIIESQNRPGICGNSQAYIGQNDDNDPNHVNPAGFDWLCFDQKVTTVILPVKQRVEALGRPFTLNVCYVGFITSSAFQQTNPAEYGELVFVVLDHLKKTFGLEPDIWETRLEPETGYQVNGTQVGQMLAAGAARARAAGYNKVMFALPSTANANNAVPYFNQALAVPGVTPYVAELVYHRYTKPTAATFQSLASTAQQYGIQTAMLEWLNGTEHSLWEDLTKANVSSWEKYALAGPYQSATVGNQLYYANLTSQTFSLRTATWYLRQYMRYIRPGDVRVGATTTLSGVEPVAFRRPNGQVVVVANAPGATTFNIGGLPAGTYTVSFSTASNLGAEGSTMVIGAGQTLTTSLPAAGTITISP